MITCDLCGQQVTSLEVLERHMQLFHSNRPGHFKCIHCGVNFTRKDNLRRHIKTSHNYLRIRYSCILCKEMFVGFQAYQTHRNAAHPATNNFEQIQQGFRGTCQVFRKTMRYGSCTVNDLFRRYKDQLYNVLSHQLVQKPNFKCNMVLGIEMFKKNERGEETDRYPFFLRSTATVIDSRRAIRAFLRDVHRDFRERMEDMLTMGSGVQMEGIEYCDLEIGSCASLDGSCATSQIVLKKLKHIEKVKEVNDTRKYQDGCFLYAIAAYFTRSENESKLNDFIDDKLNVNISLPAKIISLKRFEEGNQDLNFKINVLQAHRDEDGKYKVFPLCVSPYVSKKHTINLLWVQFTEDDASDSEGEEEEEEEEEEENDDDDDVNNEKGHFFLIRDLSKFFSSHNKLYHCENCLNAFYSLGAKHKHQHFCLQHKPQVVEIPSVKEKNNTIQWDHYNKKFRMPYIGFFDFEAILEPKKCGKCVDEEVCTHKTVVVSEQVPCTYSLLILDDERNIFHQQTYTGRNCVEVFIQEILHQEKLIMDILETNKPMILTNVEESRFQASTICHICEKPFSLSEEKVRDHAHLTGKFLGAAHKVCNLNRQTRKHIPLFCHNLKNYDSHFLIHALSVNNPNIRTVTALPQNTEKFKTFQINSLHFLDSAAFLNCKLEDLANDLNAIPNYAYSILDQTLLYNENESEKKNMLLRKGVFPYEFMTDFSLLEKTCLPSKDSFFSRLQNSSVNDKDYEHAKNVFTTFNCRTIKDYCELYCMTDCALLAEIVSQFRDEIYNDSELDICNYISLPQLTLDLMLKKTGAQIELCTDIDEILLIESNIRGGLSFISQRYACPTNENEELLYIDANNLYGAAMSEPMPVKNFKWMEEAKFQQIDWTSIDIYGDEGYILDVDLSYPSHLHELHSTYPLAPEQVIITHEMLSPYAKECLLTLKNTDKYKAKKLTCTFNDRKHYVIHFANLKLYLQLGMKLEKIHSILQFTQGHILKPYIDYCTEKRKKSISSFQSSIYKLLSNSLFGKFLECVRDRLDCRFVKSEKKCKKLIRNEHFDSFRILNENLVAVFSKQAKVMLNKAYPIGFTVLERSKSIMYDYFYNTLLKKFHSVTVLMTDTDSFAIQIRKHDKDSHLSAIDILKDSIDFSNFPDDHLSFNLNRKNELGFFKDELCGNKLTEFVGIRSKTYAMNITKKGGQSEIKRRTKGVVKGYRPTISFQDFKKCVQKIDKTNITQFNIS